MINLKGRREAMDKEKMEMVSYLVYESAQTRLDRIINRLTIALVVAIGLLFLSNALWLYAWIQYDYSGEIVAVESRDGIANFIGNDGVISNGDNSGETP